MDDTKNEENADQPLESSFNESELEEIMSEIEDLEKDFSDGTPTKVKSDPIAEEMAEAAEAEAASIEDEPVQETVTEDVVESEEMHELVTDEEMEHILDEVTDEVLKEADSLRISEEEVISKTKLQEQIDNEVNGLLSEESPKVEDSVVPISRTPAPEEMKPVTWSQSMDFSVSGELAVNMNFIVAGKKVKLCVDGKDGFTIEMEDGMKFNIPINHDHVNKAS